MRKITQEAVECFNNSTPFKKGNTEVVVSRNKRKVTMKLHGNTIAVLYWDSQHYYGGLRITNCGWFTNTTKERLNGLNGVSIHQSKGVWYLNGEAWDGKPKSIDYKLCRQRQISNPKPISRPV